VEWAQCALLRTASIAPYGPGHANGVQEDRVQLNRSENCVTRPPPPVLRYAVLKSASRALL
jgi:hypothetical protein